MRRPSLRANRSRAGISAVELAIGTTISAGLLLVAGAMTRSAGDASNAAFHRNGLMMRANRAMDRLCVELQSSGFDGEDENGNGRLDPREDTNLNGILDSAWSLPEGGSEIFITFNRVERQYCWSPPVTYEVRGKTLTRTTLGETEYLVSGDVQDLDVSRAGDRVTVRLTLRDADRRGRLWTDVIQREIYVRN